jgi:hypothetical protein
MIETPPASNLPITVLNSQHVIYRMAIVKKIQQNRNLEKKVVFCEKKSCLHWGYIPVANGQHSYPGPVHGSRYAVESAFAIRFHKIHQCAEYDSVDQHEIAKHQQFRPSWVQNGENHLNSFEISGKLDDGNQAQKSHCTEETEGLRQVASCGSKLNEGEDVGENDDQIDPVHWSFDKLPFGRCHTKASHQLQNKPNGTQLQESKRNQDNVVPSVFWEKCMLPFQWRKK